MPSHWKLDLEGISVAPFPDHLQQPCEIDKSTFVDQHVNEDAELQHLEERYLSLHGVWLQYYTQNLG